MRIGLEMQRRQRAPKAGPWVVNPASQQMHQREGPRARRWSWSWIYCRAVTNLAVKLFRHVPSFPRPLFDVALASCCSVVQTNLQCTFHTLLCGVPSSFDTLVPRQTQDDQNAATTSQLTNSCCCAYPDPLLLPPRFLRALHPPPLHIRILFVAMGKS